MSVTDVWVRNIQSRETPSNMKMLDDKHSNRKSRGLRDFAISHYHVLHIYAIPYFYLIMILL